MREYPNVPELAEKYRTYSERCFRKALPARSYSNALRAVWDRLCITRDFRELWGFLKKLHKSAFRLRSCGVWVLSLSVIVRVWRVSIFHILRAHQD